MTKTFKSLQQLNYWGTTDIPTGYKRTIYLDYLSQTIGTNLIKVLMGQRRSGKSYILRQLIATLIHTHNVPPTAIFYLNKELIEFDAIKTYTDLHELIKTYKKELNISGKVYLLLDEIQDIDGWEKLVNSLSQHPIDSYELFITGSNSTMLSSELSTYLSGRYISCEIQPFSYTEYCEMTATTKSKDSYIHYLKTGGLPELFHLTSDEIKTHYVSALYNTVVLNDIVDRYTIKDIYLMQQIFTYMLDNISNTFSINKVVEHLMAHKVKTNFETVSNYMTYIRQTFLFHEVSRYDIKGKAILTSSKKYYINDLAFKNYFFSGFDTGLSSRLENTIYLALRQKGYAISIGKLGDKEIDFIIEKNNTKAYIQVAVALTEPSTIDREFSNLEKINDQFDKYVITLDDGFAGSPTGIKTVLAWDIDAYL